MSIKDSDFSGRNGGEKPLVDPKFNKYITGEDEETLQEISPAAKYDEPEDYDDDGEQEYDEEEEMKKKKKKKKQNKKLLRNILIVLLCLVIAAAIAVVGYLFYVTHGAKYDDNGIDYNHSADLEEDDDINPAAMGDVTNADSLRDFLKSWSSNGGEIMKSKNVINVLLCGIDSKDGQATNGRSDCIMIVSINKKTKKITLSSLFRDSFIYMDIPKEDGTFDGRYEKLNAAYILGGPATLMDVVQKNYKVKIDQYIAVDFKSFTKLIDALGGVTVDVEQYEAMFIRRTSSHKNFPYGKNCKLKGSEALIYSRIRHLDDDIHRTERQRKVIKSLINSAKAATNGQLVNAYRLTAKYIRTGYSQGDVMSLIASAVSQSWMDYQLNEITIPSEEGVETTSAYVSTTSMRNQWVWIVDYPVCAQKLQQAIYGTTNIILSSDRVSALDYTNSRYSDDSDRTQSSYSGYNSYTRSTSSYYDDDDYTRRSTTRRRYSDDDEDETTNTTAGGSDDTGTTRGGDNQETPSQPSQADGDNQEQ